MRRKKYTAEFIHNCSSSSPILEQYADREYEWRNAGQGIKKAIAATEFVGWFPFTLKNLNNRNYFTVRRMRFKGELYAIVTNSAINYIFKCQEIPEESFSYWMQKSSSYSTNSHY